ncbi:hypothetical protein NliqN6_0970 [Naganishia liquefaciens]|uniref:Uncharacterized protein n=1 Tax=Naganishia liquefaciens TaxID=104408 RepID=A0A8H3TP28_9TREE|nr:hypothetical protein NliqN6_0970 [Naganishia liquefaciens]
MKDSRLPAQRSAGSSSAGSRGLLQVKGYGSCGDSRPTEENSLGRGRTLSHASSTVWASSRVNDRAARDSHLYHISGVQAMQYADIPKRDGRVIPTALAGYTNR